MSHGKASKAVSDAARNRCTSNVTLLKKIISHGMSLVCQSNFFRTEHYVRRFSEKGISSQKHKEVELTVTHMTLFGSDTPTREIAKLCPYVKKIVRIMSLMLNTWQYYNIEFLSVHRRTIRVLSGEYHIVYIVPLRYST